MQYRNLAALLAVLALGSVACSSDPAPTTTGTTTPPAESTPPTTDEPDTGDEPGVVAVIDSAFEPAEIEVAVGDTVVWDWQDTALPHNVVAKDGSFDSGDATFDPETEFEHEFTEAGTFDYLCEVHGEAMSGTVVVH